MITTDTKSKKTVLDPLSMLLQTKNSKANSAFADLLKSFNSKDIGSTNMLEQIKPSKKSSKNAELQTTSKIAIHQEELKANLQKEPITLSSLLGSIETKKDIKNRAKTEPVVLKSSIIVNEKNQELKLSITEAKEYLKEQILSSEGYKKAQIKELPKSIKGLIKVANEFGIDISKITLQNLKDSSVKSDINIKDQDVKIPVADILAKPKIEQQPLQTVSLKTLLSDKEVLEPKDNSVKEQKTIENPSTIEGGKSVLHQPLKTLLSQKEQKPSQDNIKEHMPNKPISAQVALKGEVESKKDDPAPIKTVPNQDDMLKNLLQASSDNIPQESSENLPKENQAKDISVGNSNIIINTKKTTELDVKINEAKQMVKYLSADIKQVIEEYKPPVSRIKVQLNPQSLGEIELSITQRGKNLFINLSSNNSAINILHSNLNELKTQLNNNGINNATFNFSSTTSDSAGGFFQNQKEQHKKASKEYRYFSNDEQENQEVLDSLEIVVPKYA